MPDLARLTARLNALRRDLEAVSRELLTEHHDKGAEWVHWRKQRLDFLAGKIERLERRLR